MSILLDKSEPAIRRAIKTVAVGKRGSKPLEPELITELLQELSKKETPPAALGAFAGALILKGVTPEESALENFFGTGVLSNPELLIRTVADDAPVDIQKICAFLLKGENLDQATAYRLGQFLLSNQPGDGARGLAASILRVRYETADEYQGLLCAMEETLEKSFRTAPPAGDPVLQFSEPFDGVDHSFMITPLLAAHFQKRGYRAITMVGRNSGPKLEMNLLDIVQAMGIECAQGNAALGQPKPEYGWFFNQEDLSGAVNRWVDLRRQIIKRPFLATLEKFLNPAKARIIITSAFHPPYNEKMITVAERAGFPGAVVIRNGIEGTMAFALKRAVKIMCSARQADGTYLRHEFEIDPERLLTVDVPVEEKLEQISAEENARLITAFQNSGKSGNLLFDERVRITRLGIEQALQWLEMSIQ